MVARILIVDDDVTVLQALADMVHIRIDHIAVDTCASETDAFTRIVEIDYDAIVSDIKMPGMDGITLMERVLTLRPSTPTLLITGHRDHDLGAHALKAGAYAFIQKPIERDYFVAWLTRAIQLRQLSRAVEQQNQMLARTVQERTAELERTNQELKAALEQQREDKEALRRSEANLRDFVETATIGLHWVGPDGIILWANKAELDLLGYTREEYVGHHIAEFHADAPVIEDILACLHRGETLQEYGARLRCKDGSIRHVLINSSVLFEDGKFVHTRCFTRDITERKQAEEALRCSEAQLKTELTDTKLLQGISAQLADEENIEALYEKILGAAVAIMRSEYASMQMFYPERGIGGELRLLAFRGFNPQAAKFWEWVRADSESTCGAALRTGKRVVAADIEQCEFMAGTEDLATYLQTGIHAVQTTPLLSRSGTMVGMISTHWRDPHQPSERDLLLLDILARQAADLIERRQAEQALRESKERFSALVNASAQIVWTTDAEGEVVEDSLSWRAFTGQTWEQWKGWGWLDALHPDDRDRVAALWRKAVAYKKPFDTAYRLRHVDHEWRWTAVRAVPLYNDNADGSVRGWVGMNSDITERKQAEAEREKLLNQLQRERRRLEDVQEQLQDKIQDLEKFHDVVVGRELKLIETETELERLRQEVARLTSLMKARF